MTDSSIFPELMTLMDEMDPFTGPEENSILLNSTLNDLTEGTSIFTKLQQSLSELTQMLTFYQKNNTPTSHVFSECKECVSKCTIFSDTGEAVSTRLLSIRDLQAVLVYCLKEQCIMQTSTMTKFNVTKLHFYQLNIDILTDIIKHRHDIGETAELYYPWIALLNENKSHTVSQYIKHMLSTTLSYNIDIVLPKIAIMNKPCCDISKSEVLDVLQIYNNALSNVSNSNWYNQALASVYGTQLLLKTLSHEYRVTTTHIENVKAYNELLLQIKEFQPNAILDTKVVIMINGNIVLRLLFESKEVAELLSRDLLPLAPYDSSRVLTIIPYYIF